MEKKLIAAYGFCRIGNQMFIAAAAKTLAKRTDRVFVGLIEHKSGEYPEVAGAIDLAITAMQDYQPWIPVSNVKPESGKHVLLCCEIKPLGKRYVCDGYYAQSKTITTICDGDNNYEYDEETDEYYLTEGYYEIIENWDDYSSIVIEDFVTHWKPLPEQPEARDDGC